MLLVTPLVWNAFALKTFAVHCQTIFSHSSVFFSWRKANEIGCSFKLLKKWNMCFKIESFILKHRKPRSIFSTDTFWYWIATVVRSSVYSNPFILLLKQFSEEGSIDGFGESVVTRASTPVYGKISEFWVKNCIFYAKLYILIVYSSFCRTLQMSCSTDFCLRCLLILCIFICIFLLISFNYQQPFVVILPKLSFVAESPSQPIIPMSILVLVRLIA